MMFVWITLWDLFTLCTCRTCLERLLAEVVAFGQCGHLYGLSASVRCDLLCTFSRSTVRPWYGHTSHLKGNMFSCVVLKNVWYIIYLVSVWALFARAPMDASHVPSEITGRSGGFGTLCASVWQLSLRQMWHFMRFQKIQGAPFVRTFVAFEWKYIFMDIPGKMWVFRNQPKKPIWNWKMKNRNKIYTSTLTMKQIAAPTIIKIDYKTTYILVNQ